MGGTHIYESGIYICHRQFKNGCLGSDPSLKMWGEGLSEQPLTEKKKKTRDLIADILSKLLQKSSLCSPVSGISEIISEYPSTNIYILCIFFVLICCHGN